MYKLASKLDKLRATHGPSILTEQRRGLFPQSVGSSGEEIGACRERARAQFSQAIVLSIEDFTHGSHARLSTYFMMGKLTLLRIGRQTSLQSATCKTPKLSVCPHESHTSLASACPHSTLKALGALGQPLATQ